MKNIDWQFEAAKNYWMSYVNITHAIFCMLNEIIDDSFKVSNNPKLMGWNPRMSIRLILEQLEVSYGQPKSNTLWENNTLFKLVFAATDAPKRLFHHIEQCKEVAIMGQIPYMQAQLITNAVHLLLASGLFPMKEFKDWEAIAVKTCPALKMVMHGTYSRHLIFVQLRNTSGLRGYTRPRICMQLWPMGMRIQMTTQLP
jgi:hypothetical protein